MYVILKNFKVLLYSILILSMIMPSLHAKEDFSYPELLVTPRASTRLQIEATREQDEGFFAHLPMQISALATFTSGILQLSYVDEGKDEDKQSPWAGILVGGTWIALNFYFGAYHQPYYHGLKKIEKISNKGARNQLTRERLAEESINNAASLAKRMILISCLTNAGASGYMYMNAEKDSLAKLTNIVSMALAFGPLIFSNHWVDVSNEQKSYKKKIYAPLISSTALYDRVTKRLAPGLLFSMSF